MNLKPEEFWEDCICGNKYSHTKPCRREHYRRKHNQKFVPIRREQRRKLRKENRCVVCAKKVKPIKIYHQYCKYHKEKEEKARKLREERKKTIGGVSNA